jgi:hypothetical protein
VVSKALLLNKGQIEGWAQSHSQLLKITGGGFNMRTKMLIVFLVPLMIAAFIATAQDIPKGVKVAGSPEVMPTEAELIKAILPSPDLMRYGDLKLIRCKTGRFTGLSIKMSVNNRVNVFL